jgi:hypothetical protein
MGTVAGARPVKENAMTVNVQTVKEEHQQFLPYLESIREVADSVGRVSDKSLLARTGEIYEFLAHRLMPHAVAEGKLMFPVVRGFTGSPEIALGMNQCHVQLGRFTDDLESVRGLIRKRGLDTGLESELRRVLYGIHALLTAHFAQAEDVFTTALERMSPEERARLFESVERSAEEVSNLYE